MTAWLEAARATTMCSDGDELGPRRQRVERKVPELRSTQGSVS